jgi:hypothetical protein
MMATSMLARDHPINEGDYGRLIREMIFAKHAH